MYTLENFVSMFSAYTNGPVSGDFVKRYIVTPSSSGLLASLFTKFCRFVSTPKPSFVFLCEFHKLRFTWSILTIVPITCRPLYGLNFLKRLLWRKPNIHKKVHWWDVITSILSKRKLKNYKSIFLLKFRENFKWWETLSKNTVSNVKN